MRKRIPPENHGLNVFVVLFRVKALFEEDRAHAYHSPICPWEEQGVYPSSNCSS